MSLTTTTDEIAADIFRFSTFVPDVGPTGFTFNQFFINAEEPLLFHTGPRQMFPLVSEAIARVRPIEQLRWVSFGHVESDECGSMNQLLAAAPHATVLHNPTGCAVSLNDLSDRTPEAIADGQTKDLGNGRIVRAITTPHVPHNWESHVLFEESTQTLLCGDIFTALGNGPALVEDDPIGPAMEAETVFGATSLSPRVGATLRRLAELEPRTLALMHGSSYSGDGAKALVGLADAYDAYAIPGT